MKPSHLLSLGCIALISILGAAYLAFDVVRVQPLRQDLHATLVLPSAGGLEVGAPVLLRGVKVGKVTELRRGKGRVEADFTVAQSYRLPVNTAVTVEALSALGEPYIEFAPNTDGGPYLADHQVLTGLLVRTPLTTAEVARLVTRILNQVDPDAVRGLVGTLATALDGTESLTPGLARSSDLLAATLLSRAPSIGRIMTDLQSIAPDMDWTGPSLQSAAPNFIQFGQKVDEIATAVGRLAQTGDTPAMYLEGDGLVPFLNRLTRWIDTAGPELKPLSPVLQPLVDATVSAPRLDLSALISQALADTDPAGAVHLRVDVK